MEWILVWFFISKEVQNFEWEEIPFTTEQACEQQMPSIQRQYPDYYVYCWKKEDFQWMRDFALGKYK
jgi:hypothetical protein